MIAISGAVICLAYILGLLLTGIPGEVRGIPVGAIALLTLGVSAAFLLPRLWQTGPKLRIWLLAAVCGFLAILYFQWRIPKPETTDISTLINAVNTATPAQLFAVQGRIDTPLHLTRSQKIQFELQVTETNIVPNQGKAQKHPSAVTGRVYVTVPLLQGTGFYPGQAVTVTGSLYKPKPAVNPGGFDFEKYLAQQGIFAGLNGKQVDFLEIEEEGSSHITPQMPFLLWSIRQRIIRAQVSSLGVPEGALVSAMVMGKGAVDVPYDLQDQFKQVGLAHALAASGAQVSMLVAMVLALTRRLPTKLRFGCGVGVLLFYVGLTGLEASVLRAAIMGFVALFALTVERKVKPFGSILFAATLLLLWNPLLIWDLGFQLSFLATLGLLVTVPVLTNWLDWMPAAIAPLFTVPIAAYLWTLPLQLFAFGIVSPYSILINILVSPFIAVLSIGGMISALAALIYPPAGSISAWPLYYPTHLFIKIAEIGSQLPGGAFAVGRISVWQVVVLYGLMGLIWGWKRSQRQWWIAGVLGVSLVAIPVWYASTTLFQVTALETSGDPVLVIQNQGKVGLVNSGSEADTRFTVLPFLQQQGINRVDWAIAPSLHASEIAGWQRILESRPIQSLYSRLGSNQAVEISTGNDTQRVEQPDQPIKQSNQSANELANGLGSSTQTLLNQIQLHRGASLPLSNNQTIQLGSATAKLTNSNPAALQLQIGAKNWLLLSNLPDVSQQTEAIAKHIPAAQILGWSGRALSPAVLEAIHPEVAIASSNTLPLEMQNWFQKHSVTVYLTGQNGAVQWTPKKGFVTTLESIEPGSA